MTYQQFLEMKAQFGCANGFKPIWMGDFLLDFQQYLTEWSIERGRSAIFSDCGTGKTAMALVWGQNIVEKTNGKVLNLTPLAVAPQTIREAQKFGVNAHRSSGKMEDGARIIVTNYEQLHHFDPKDFAGVIADESSCLKSFDGKRRAQVTEFMRTIPYRLLCTATAAPNDYIELGTSSETLGELGHVDMLNRFFKNDNNSSDMKGRYKGFSAPRNWEGQRWRFKGHAEKPFWRYICSWSRSCRRPSDLGFQDGKFLLPKLIEREHIVEARTLADGMLFSMPATNMGEEREERRRTIDERCEMAAQLVMHSGKPAVIFYDLNEEGKKIAKLIPGCGHISGSTLDEKREEVYEGFSLKKVRVLVIQRRVGSWGLNWQHCAHVVTFETHSWEQYYQGVRRCWRFGQEHDVIVDLITTEGGSGVRDNMRRKAKAADRMFDELIAHMHDAMRLERGHSFDKEVSVPVWL